MKVSYWVLGLIISLGCIFLIQQSNQYFHNEEILADHLEADLHQIEQDVATTLLDRKLFAKLLNSLQQQKILSNDVIQELNSLANKSFSIYLYKEDSLMYWSKPGLVIDPQYLKLKSFPAVMSDHREDFLIKRYEQFNQKDKYTSFVKIPLINNQTYTGNIGIRPLTDINKFERPSTARTVHSIEGEAIFSIQLIGSSFPKTGQYAILVLLLMSVLFAIGLIHSLAEKLTSKIGKTNVALLKIATVILFRALSFILNYHQYFDDVSIVQSLFSDQTIPYSLFDFVLDGALLLWIVSKLSMILSGTSGLDKDKGLILQLNSIGNFLILILITGLLSWLMRSVVIYSNLNLDLENISFFNLHHFLCLLGFGLFTLASLVLVHELIRQNIRLIPNLYTRIAHLVLAGLVSLPLLGMIPIGASLFGFFLAVFISSMLLDLYIEKGSKSVTWVITWLIAIAGFSSILLYKYQQDNDFLRRVETLDTVEQRLKNENGTMEQKLLEWLPRMSSKYSLGIYDEDQMVFNHRYNYPIVLTEQITPSKQSYSEQSIQNRSELSKRTEDGLWIFAGKEIQGPIGVISLFSYIFTIYSILLFFVAIANSIGNFMPEAMNISFSARPTLRNKIQLAILFIILLTFIIIGIVTVFYMRSTTQIDLEKRYEDRLQTLSTSLNQSSNMRSWQGAVAQAAKVAYANNSRSKIYDPDGNLTFQNERIRNGTKPPPVKMSFISKMLLDLSNKNFTLEKINAPDQAATIGFISISSPQNVPLGYIEFPNIDFLGKKDDPGAHLFSNLLNAYVFLFLIAVALAIAIANSITRPLSELSDKMKMISLGKKNEPISWNNEDEIGDLINDYNSMIHQLDVSARMLAQNERDLAWREMAKQVAHEIKNPLTPMKLSIQYLQNAIRHKKENLNELVGRVSLTLIEQIDNLANIANEFSNFAKMPQSVNEQVILNEVIASVHDLFRKREDMDISLYVPIDEMIVFADKNQLIRVFNNILKNAIQAIPDTKRGKIDIQLYKENQLGIIKIKDNGVGISEEMKKRVFYPNFTTKSSGTGLGLAMSSNIIESYNGRIYFETEVGHGSTFIIELPLMKLQSNFAKEERVTL
jgi:signal transduction histidine kinase